MTISISKAALIGALCLGLSACGGIGFKKNVGLFGNRKSPGTAEETAERSENRKEYDKKAAGAQAVALGEVVGENGGESLLDVFRSPNENTNVRVNKYLWNATLQTLSFLPIEAADPFTGVIVFDWGRAPGSNQQYRATALIQDPALDARSLKLSIQRRGGAASVETVRRIEGAILTRARQLRIEDGKRESQKRARRNDDCAGPCVRRKTDKE